MTSTPAWGLSDAAEDGTDENPSGTSEAVTGAHSDSLVGIIGSAVSLPEIEINLTDNQKKAVCLIYRLLYVNGDTLDSGHIRDMWPESGVIDNTNYFRAGPRPTINDIQAYMGTVDFQEKMELLGVRVNLNETGLSVEQIGLLTILTNPTDGRTLKGKLKAAGVSYPVYQAWLKHPKFQEVFRSWASNALMDAIPAAEIQLAAAMGNGDLGALKFGMEVTGRHDPASKKQIDAQKLVGVILEVLEEKIKDTELLRSIGNQIQLRAITALE